jgi:ADP-ribosyl-[dinitrogen reductase] hydrolase
MSDEIGARGRVAGALVGLAVGDALGLPVEFEPRKAREADPVLSLRGGGTWRLEPGSWSDDAALALCLAESIVLKGFDPEDSGKRSLAWLDEGYWSARGQAIGAGGATMRALGRIRSGLPAVLAGGRGENDNGNGSLMRILPASAWLASLPEPARLRAIAAYSSVTHGHPRSILGAWLHCLVSSRLLRGEAPKEAYLGAMEEARSLQGSLPAALRAEAGAYARVLDGGLASVPAARIRASGYVVHCLEASLWCLVNNADFPSSVLAAVNLGEDADTTGAVTGGLAGLAYGRAAIPGEWAASLARGDEIEALAGKLAGLVETQPPLPRSYWVLPGKFLAGGYPGRDKGGGPEGAALEALLDSGVDAFLDLTAPGEEAGAVPYAAYLGPAASRRGVPVERRQTPIEDMAAPGAAVGRALRDLDSFLESGKTVYLHCVGGLGRTGTIVGSFLVEKGLAAPEEAVALIGALRAGTDKPAAESPQTEEQRRLVESTRPGPSALPL